MSNPPAFPRTAPAGEDDLVTIGMTLRDYFAAKIAPACLEGARMPEETWPELLPMVARLSYAIADAMLAERAK